MSPAAECISHEHRINLRAQGQIEKIGREERIVARVATAADADACATRSSRRGRLHRRLNNLLFSRKHNASKIRDARVSVVSSEDAAHISHDGRLQICARQRLVAGGQLSPDAGLQVQTIELVGVTVLSVAACR